MLIYTALEHYPSLYKPYFDTQFEDFIKSGHNLEIYSVEQQGNQVSEKVSRNQLNQITKYYPATLKHVPDKLITIIKNYFLNPVFRTKVIFKLIDNQSTFKHNIMNIFRMLILPVTAPDLFLVHNLTTATHFKFLKNLYPNSKIILYYHGGEISGVPRLDQVEADSAFQYPDIILTNTKNSMQHAINRGSPENKLSTNPVGFDIDEFNVKKNKTYRISGKFNFISIGRISWEKGFIFALEAINKLVEAGYKDLHYTVIGDGAELVNLKDFVESNNLSQFVDFPGQESSRTRLYEKISQSDALILPSISTDAWEETQGCVLQEAMILKTLVLTSTSGGIPESIAPQMVEFSFKPEDPEALKGSLIKVMNLSDDDLIRLGEECRDYTVIKYDIKRLNQNILKLI